MYFIKVIITLFTLSSLSCIDRDSSDADAPNNQNQTVLHSNNTSPTLESQKFPENISETTPLYYAINKAKVDINYEGEKQPPVQICDFSTPPSWGSRTVVATVTRMNYFVEDKCVDENQALRMHNEATVKIHSTLYGPTLPEGSVTTILYGMDNHYPTLRVGENILVHYLSRDERNFALNTLLVENDPEKFEQHSADGEGRVLATPENEYVNLPDTYGELSNQLSSIEEDYVPMCTSFDPDPSAKQALIDRFFKTSTTCDGKTSISE